MERNTEESLALWMIFVGFNVEGGAEAFLAMAHHKRADQNYLKVTTLV